VSNGLLLLGCGSATVGGGGGGGSFTTFSPTLKNAAITLSGGDLQADQSNNGVWCGVRSAVSFGGGKWHIETQLPLISNGSGFIGGIIKASNTTYSYPGVDADGLGFQIGNFFYHNGGFYDPDNPGALTPGDWLIWEIDDDNGTLDVAINTGSYARATYPGAIAAGAGVLKHFAVGLFTPTNNCIANFGDSAWVKTPTSGFVGLS
jgi:hypothetical protein